MFLRSLLLLPVVLPPLAFESLLPELQPRAFKPFTIHTLFPKSFFSVFSYHNPRPGHICLHVSLIFTAYDSSFTLCFRPTLQGYIQWTVSWIIQAFVPHIQFTLLTWWREQNLGPCLGEIVAWLDPNWDEILLEFILVCSIWCILKYSHF